MLEVSQHFKWASKANAWTEAIRSLSAKNTMTGFITNSLAQTFALFFFRLQGWEGPPVKTHEGRTLPVVVNSLALKSLNMLKSF
jgi:hypothetical protein